MGKREQLRLSTALLGRSLPVTHRPLMRMISWTILESYPIIHDEQCPFINMYNHNTISFLNLEMFLTLSHFLIFYKMKYIRIQNNVYII